MRLIDADALMSQAFSTRQGYDVVLVEDIVNAPTVDAEPVRHGRWIDNNNKTWSCSICQSWIPDEQHSYARHCLHCGARMDGDTNG